MVRLMNDRIYFISFNSVIVFGSVSSKTRISTWRDHKRVYINYVDKQRGAEGSSTYYWIINLSINGEGGVKNSKKSVNVVYRCPLIERVIIISTLLIFGRLKNSICVNLNFKSLFIDNSKDRRCRPKWLSNFSFFWSFLF